MPAPPLPPLLNRPHRASSCRHDPRHPSHGRRCAVSHSSNNSGSGNGFPRGTFSSNGDDRMSSGSKTGYYLDATDYETGTVEERTEAKRTVGSGPARSFSNSDESKEDKGTQELS